MRLTYAFIITALVASIFVRVVSSQDSVITDMPAEEAPASPFLREVPAAPGDCTVSSTDLPLEPFEEELLELVNQYRAENGAGPVGWSQPLIRAATYHARDMATDPYYFSHTSRDGRNMGARINDCGFDNPYTWRGENLAGGQGTPQDAMIAWKGSPGHNALMLDPKYRAAGIGHVVDTAATYTHYWALDVASDFDSRGELLPVDGDCTVPLAELAPTAEEQTLLDTINQYRTVDYLWSNTLSRAAVWMAKDNASRKLEDNHIDSLGRDLRARATDCGYPAALPIGENTMAGLTYGAGDLSALSEWMFEPADWINVTGTQFTHAGIARAYNPFSPYIWHWVLVVGREGVVPPTPVAPMTPTRTSTPAPTATQTPVAPSSTPTPTRTPTTVPTATPPLTATLVPTPPVGAGLLGSYYVGPYLTGAPLLRVDPQIDFVWGTEPPIQGFPHDGFSVRWEGWVYLEAGRWRFQAVTDDGVRLWINERYLINRWQRKSNWPVDGYLTVAAPGWVRLRMEYFEAAQQAQAQLLYGLVGQPLQLIPTENLRVP